MRVIASQRLRTLGASVQAARVRNPMTITFSAMSRMIKCRLKMRREMMRRNQATSRTKAAVTTKVIASPPVSLRDRLMAEMTLTAR